MLIKNTLVCALIVLVGCWTEHNGAIDGHWHCVKPGRCDFETLDIKDSVIVFDKHVINSYPHAQDFSEANLRQGIDFQIRCSGTRLFLHYSGTDFNFIRSDTSECSFSDWYLRSQIELSLPEITSALVFDNSESSHWTGNLFVGKLKSGISSYNDELSTQYPDSIFIQVEDVLINLKDVPQYVTRLEIRDWPKPEVNIHADNDVPEIIIGKIVKQINPYPLRTANVYTVVKLKTGRLGRMRR